MTAQVITSAEVPLDGVRIEASAPAVFSSQAGLASIRHGLTAEVAS